MAAAMPENSRYGDWRDSSVDKKMARHKLPGHSLDLSLIQAEYAASFRRTLHP